jgi:hypothetical protein
MPQPLTSDRIEELWGCPVFDRAGQKIGTLEEVFDEAAGRGPRWLGIGIGLLGRRLVLAPADGAVETYHRITVSYPLEIVHAAPEVRHDDLDEETARTLEAYYALADREQLDLGGLPDLAVGA